MSGWGPVRSGGAAVPRQRGVALAIVVWFIAGMSLLVAGIVAQGRADTRMAQLHVARAKVAAAGDGAIVLLLAERLAAGPGDRGEAAGVYRLGDLEVGVSLVPAAALIDLQSAPPEVLAALFSGPGGLDEAAAGQLALNVVQSRAPPPGGSGARFDTVEDLLGVPGASRSLLDQIRDFIVVGSSGQGGTDWSQAPGPVLAVLERANPDRARAVSVRREERGGAPALLAGAYRADAVVRYGDRTWLRRRWIDMVSAAGSELPWRVTRTEPPRVTGG